MLHDTVLDNGLRVIIHPDPGSPVVAVNVLYRVGSRYEPPGARGFAHLFEHLMFDGSPSLARGEYDRYCTMAGGENNAWTSHDLTDYWITLPADYLELGLRLEADRMSGFVVGQESLDTQRGVIRAEKQQVIDNVPYGSEGTLLRELLYDIGHPYRHEPIGSMDDLEAATLDDTRDFYRRYYIPANALLVLSGPRDVDTAMRLIETTFATIASGPRPEQPPLPDASLLTIGRRHATTDPLAALNGVFLGWHLPDLRSDAIAPYELLSMILADGDSSRFAMALEYDPMIASESSAMVEEGELGSVFRAYAIAQEEESPAELESALMEQLALIAADGVEPEELRKAITRKASAVVRSLGSAAVRAERIAWFAATLDDPTLVWHEASIYESITSEQVADAARALVDVPAAALEYRQG